MLAVDGAVPTALCRLRYGVKDCVLLELELGAQCWLAGAQTSVFGGGQRPYNGQGMWAEKWETEEEGGERGVQGMSMRFMLVHVQSLAGCQQRRGSGLAVRFGTWVVGRGRGSEGWARPKGVMGREWG